MASDKVCLEEKSSYQDILSLPGFSPLVPQPHPAPGLELTIFFKDSFRREDSSVLPFLEESHQLLATHNIFQSLGNLTQLSTSPSSLFFANTYVCDSNSQLFSIYNPGNQTVQINSIVPPYGFFVSPTAGQIPPNKKLFVRVTFRPYSEQYYSGSIVIYPNANQAYRAYVYVSGNGIKR